MDFTREPIIETVITPKDGFKIVIRSSKGVGQEEYFVDAVEVVSFGNSLFFRSTERPKCFLLPMSDYEVLEVRETRMVLKHVGYDRAIKIGGGREGHIRTEREPRADISPEERQEEAGVGEEQRAEGGKKRDRRRQSRRRRGRGEREAEIAPGEGMEEETEQLVRTAETVSASEGVVTTASLSSLLAPPPKLISEMIASYKDDERFREAFYRTDEELGEEGEMAANATESSPLTQEASETSEHLGYTHFEEVKDDLWDFTEETPSINGHAQDNDHPN